MAEVLHLILAVYLSVFQLLCTNAG